MTHLTPQLCSMRFSWGGLTESIPLSGVCTIESCPFFHPDCTKLAEGMSADLLGLGRLALQQKWMQMQGQVQLEKKMQHKLECKQVCVLIGVIACVVECTDIVTAGSAHTEELDICSVKM